MLPIIIPYCDDMSMKRRPYANRGMDAGIGERIYEKQTKKECEIGEISEERHFLAEALLRNTRTVIAGMNGRHMDNIKEKPNYIIFVIVRGIHRTVWLP